MEHIAGYEAGTLINGRYEIVQYLGVGAMGMVFKVLDRQLRGEYVALKLLHPHLIVTERSVERFKIELVLARKLLSPSIVRFYEFGKTSGGQYFVTMELVEGSTLAKVLEAGALSLAEATQILKQVCQGLIVAHESGVVHRDVKPQNILIDHDGLVKLTDFGTARLLIEERETLTRTGEAIGTPHYMSPEQFRGGAIDERSDIYSLGITFFEMLSGRRPFDADTYLSLALAQLEQEVPALASLPEAPTSLPSWCDVFIAKATAKDPIQRFQTVEEMRAALEEECSPEGVENAAAMAFARARRQDIESSRIRLRRVCARALASFVFISLTAGYLLPRLSNSMFMRMSIPPLKLVGTRYDPLAQFILEYVRFPRSQLDRSFFDRVESASVREHWRYALIASIRAGIDLSERGFDQRTPLMAAFAAQQGRIVEEIVAQGVDLDLKDAQERTAAFYCLEYLPGAAYLKLLNDHGARLDVVDHSNESLFHFAARFRRPRAAKYLVEQVPTLLNKKNASGDTPLHTLVKGLLNFSRSRANSEYVDGEFEQAYADTEEVLSAFLEGGAELEHRDAEGRTPIEIVEDLEPTQAARILRSLRAALASGVAGT